MLGDDMSRGVRADDVLCAALRESVRSVPVGLAAVAVAFPVAVGACAPPPAARVTPELPKYGASATPLSRAHDYFREAAAPDFWALVPYYVAQQNDQSCSLASLSMVVNAVRRGWPLSAEQPLVTQPLLSSAVASDLWTKGLAPGGEGVTLDQLGLLASQSLAAFQSRGRVEVTHVEDESAESLSQLRTLLARNEASGDDYLLFNFLVEPFTGVGDYGHIAPVGAYDAPRRRILILDPDRKWYEPYWVPDDVALRGLATVDDVSGKHRGYVYIEAQGAGPR
jgi:hypothetical protein